MKADTQNARAVSWTFFVDDRKEPPRGPIAAASGRSAACSAPKRTEFEPVAHIQLEAAVGVDVGPEQWGLGPPVGVGEPPRPKPTMEPPCVSVYCGLGGLGDC